MKVDRTVARATAGERRAGRDIGHALGSYKLVDLAAFSRAIADAVATDPYAEGYRDALADVVAAFRAEWQSVTAAWPAGWEDTIAALRHGGRCPTEIATACNVSLATASRRLAAMEKHGILSVLDSTVDGRSKIYMLKGLDTTK